MQRPEAAWSARCPAGRVRMMMVRAATAILASKIFAGDHHQQQALAIIAPGQLPVVTARREIGGGTAAVGSSRNR